MIRLLLAIFCLLPAAAGAQDWPTRCGNSERHCWQDSETELTPATVGRMVLRWRLDTGSPLGVPPVVSAGIAYQADDADTVTAVRVSDGVVLGKRTIGATWQVGGGYVGITSTPAIADGRLYVVAADAGQYVLHALDLTTLADVVPPAVIGGSVRLRDGSQLAFDPAVHLIHGAVLADHGHIYVPVTGIGEGPPCQTYLWPTGRGWLYGWDAATLLPLPASPYVPDLEPSRANCFDGAGLWSRTGPAADENGNVYFLTGNSDLRGAKSEAAIKLSPGLDELALFTRDQLRLDNLDADLAAGSLVLFPGFAALQGKHGPLRLLDRDLRLLGAYHQAGEQEPDCWCTSAYYRDAAGAGHVVSAYGVRPVDRTIVGKSLAEPARLPRWAEWDQEPGEMPVVVSDGSSGPMLVTTVKSRWSNAADWPTYPVSLMVYDLSRGGLLFGPTIVGAAASFPAPVVTGGLVLVATGTGLQAWGLP